MDELKEREYEEGHHDHYTGISSSYDTYYVEYTKAIVTIISRTVPFSSTDTVLDISGRTGEIGHQLWKKFNFKQPVVCVDPSESLLEVAKEKEGLKTLQATAEDYASCLWDGTQFSRVIMIGCVHHLKDPGLVLEGIGKMLTNDGVCIIGRIMYNCEPFAFSKSLPHYKPTDFNEIARLAESKANLKAKVTCGSEFYELSKEFCCEFIRRRMLSFLEACTEREIEDGISEFMEKYQDVDLLKAQYKLSMVVISRQ